MVRLGGAVVALLTLGYVIWAASHRPERPLHIAINPWPGFEFAPLAQTKGFFQEEGVEVHLVEMASLSDSRRAFELGQVDGFFGTPVEWIVAEAHSTRRGAAVLVADASEGADVILARRSISTIADLQGKRVGLERGSLHVLVLAEAMRSIGGSIEDIEIVHLSALEAGLAFRDGEIDAVVSYPPFSLDIVASGDAHTVFSTREIPGRVVDLLIIDASLLDARADELARISRAYFRAQRFAAEHPQQALPIMAARQRISVEAFTQSLADGLRLIGEAEQSAYLKPGGTLDGILSATREALIMVGEIESPHPLATGSDDDEGRSSP
jgi:NitT/TauT family transport system substrate-binding protein